MLLVNTTKKSDLCIFDLMKNGGCWDDDQRAMFLFFGEPLGRSTGLLWIGKHQISQHIHPSIHSFIYPSMHPCMRSLIDWWVIDWLTEWLTDWWMDSWIHGFTGSLVHWVIASLLRWFTLHWFTDPLIQSFHWHLNHYLLSRWCNSQLQHFIASAPQQEQPYRPLSLLVSILRTSAPVKKKVIPEKTPGIPEKRGQGDSRKPSEKNITMWGTTFTIAKLVQITPMSLWFMISL